MHLRGEVSRLKRWLVSRLISEEMERIEQRFAQLSKKQANINGRITRLQEKVILLKGLPEELDREVSTYKKNVDRLFSVPRELQKNSDAAKRLSIRVDSLEETISSLRRAWEESTQSQRTTMARILNDASAIENRNQP